MNRSETVENPYETASTRNGTPRERVKSAPPTGGATRRTIDIRAIVTLAASASCGVGTTAFIAPLEPER